MCSDYLERYELQDDSPKVGLHATTVAKCRIDINSGPNSILGTACTVTYLIPNQRSRCLALKNRGIAFIQRCIKNRGNALPSIISLIS